MVPAQIFHKIWAAGSTPHQDLWCEIITKNHSDKTKKDRLKVSGNESIKLNN